VLPVLCELYTNTEQYEKASKYLERGFELLNPDQNWYGLPAPIYLAKAILEAKQRNWTIATGFFDKAIHINRQYELLWDEAKTNYEWGRMYIARNQKGDTKIASEKFSLSTDVFTGIGAKKYVDKAVSERNLL
jgi:tetratricopeptide (TPR) repeat protein